MPPGLALEIPCACATLRACRFTSFIAENAKKTAKSSFPPVIGKARNARIAAQRNSRRSFRRLRQLTQVRVRPHHARPLAVAVALAPAEGRIGIEEVTS